MTPEERIRRRERWKRLTPYHRRLLKSHLPDDFERDVDGRADLLAELETVFGPRQWDATVAVLAEGDEALERVREPDYAMTLEEVGVELGVHRERVRQMQERALEKLRDYDVHNGRALQSLLDSSAWMPLRTAPRRRR